MSNLNLITCPGCNAKVDEAFYIQHTESGHKMYVVNIKGIGPEIIPGSRHQTPVFLDLPYIGRVRRDAWIVYTLAILLLGVLLGAHII